MALLNFREVVFVYIDPTALHKNHINLLPLQKEFYKDFVKNFIKKLK